MDQSTHAWIAIRAVALLEDSGEHDGLVKLLKPNVPEAAIGAWIPDKTDAKRGGGQTQHHVLKMSPYSGHDAKRFVADRDDLLGRTCGSRTLRKWLADDVPLSSDWWLTPFKADPAPGQHLPNRAMALSSMLRDLLIIGTDDIDRLLLGDVDFTDSMQDSTRTRPEQAALYFFMLSHFVADASMPCHCDGRALAGYGKGLHEDLEKCWSKLVGHDFGQKTLTQGDESAVDPVRLLDLARSADSRAGVTFDGTWPVMSDRRDIWLEMVDVCRASFALDSIIAPSDRYPYESDGLLPFETVFGSNESLLKKVNATVLADAVENTAMAWTYVWNRAAGK